MNDEVQANDMVGMRTRIATLESEVSHLRGENAWLRDLLGLDERAKQAEPEPWKRGPALPGGGEALVVLVALQRASGRPCRAMAERPRRALGMGPSGRGRVAERQAARSPVRPAYRHGHRSPPERGDPCRAVPAPARRYLPS